MTDHIHVVLLLNTLQRLVIEEIFDHIIQNKDRLYITREDQLLLYVRGERGIGKNCVIYGLEMGFTLLNRRNELIISALIGCAVEDREGSMVHTVLSISTHKTKSLCTNVSRI